MSTKQITWLTCFFLVMLRLAIGWHFLFEGLEKVHTYVAEAAPAEAPGDTPPQPQYGMPVEHPVHPAPAKALPRPKKPWSSEAYLREAKGPLAVFFHWLAGDSLLDRLEVKPRQDSGPADKPEQRFPEALDKDWTAYFDRFVQHYHIEDEAQLKRLEGVLNQRKAQTVQWLLIGEKEVTTNAPRGNAPLTRKVPIRQRVKEYKAKVKQLREMEADYATLRQQPNGLDELNEVKSEVNRLRGELQGALDAQTAEMKAALLIAVDEDRADQQDRADPKKPADLTNYQPTGKLAEYGPVPEPGTCPMGDWARLDWVNFLTRWGLVIIGACLLAGLLTRTACVAGAAFLLMLYLAIPPFPWLPPNPRAEGHYNYLDKNLIEMLALLTLATTRSGRWAGLDGLLQYLRPQYWRSGQPEPVPPKPVVAEKPVSVAPVPVAPVKPKKPHTIEILGMPPPEPMPPPPTKEPPHGH
jgi:uncharacterized membrane protein YphA (DoxX/SURF4 family)